ncbi:DNA mismatch repair protein MutS [Dyadobacter sp. Leaf189]|nr:DNA mismatch repair protein MutS [Dyadobacter sp. Leaf189]
MENLISIFSNNAALRASIAAQVAKLNKKDAYYLPGLFQEKYLQRPKWFWLVQILCGISVLSVFLSFFFPQLFIFLIVLLPVNLGIHYWNKNNLYQYGSSIPQLLLLNKTARNILVNREFDDASKELGKSIATLDGLGPAMSIFKIEASLQSEIGQFVDYVIELIKALFLIEPVLLFTTLKILENRKADISAVFHFVAETDLALSTLALREDIPYYCIPEINASDKRLTVKDMYHPLLFGGVSNDIDLNNKSALLTGSNMSGKTTFIRTVGINAILGQTINTCFASSISMPPMQVYSSIRISDDLLSEKSYYFEEVLSLKQLLEHSRNGEYNLFLLDELFKGTNSVERIAIGKSVLTYLAGGKNLVLVSTHDRELADYLAGDFEIFHFTEVIDQNDIHFDYKIKPGKLTTTNAIRILELNHYPAAVIEEAHHLSQKLKSGD